MVWWDERAAGPTAPPTRRRLRAAVDLECPVLRSLVVDALSTRPEWDVTVVTIDPADDEAACTPSPAAVGADFAWSEYERVDWPAVHAGTTLASAYCVRKGITRKAQLAVNLKKWVAKRPTSPLVGRVPETHVLTLDDPDYVDEAMADLPEVRDAPPGTAPWIVKPSLANRAAGVCVIDCADGLRAALTADPDLREFVVQRYIHPPHLLGGKKWHVRAYALAVGALKVYALSDGLVLRARGAYEGAALTNLDAHLTNTCRGGGDSDDGARPDPNPDTVLALSELADALIRDGTDPTDASRRVADLTHRVAAIVGETFAAVSSELTFFALPSAFELFGFDIMVDADWTPWLLEVNADPDVGATGTRLHPLLRGAVEGALRLTADPLAREAGWDVEERASGGDVRWELVFERDAGRGGGGGMTVF